MWIYFYRSLPQKPGSLHQTHTGSPCLPQPRRAALSPWCSLKARLTCNSWEKAPAPLSVSISAPIYVISVPECLVNFRLIKGERSGTLHSPHIMFNRARSSFSDASSHLIKRTIDIKCLVRALSIVHSADNLSSYPHYFYPR